MKSNARNLFWIKLLTLVWLAAGVFAYPVALYVKYIESDKQLNAVESSVTSKHWDSLDVSNDISIQFMENFWHIENVPSFVLDGTGSDILNPTDWLHYSCLNQSISLISFQYFHSALPA